jgi:hypothetical protein
MAISLALTLGFQNTEEAVLRLLDWDTKKTLRDLTYRSPVSTFLERLRQSHPERVPPNITAKCKFNGGTFWGNHFYTCTFNEVLRINLADWTIDDYFTRKTFNDLHQTYVDETGIYVCSAGLDLVEQFDFDNNFKACFGLTSVAVWEKHSPNRDYRYEPNIDGRESHPNHLFRYRGRLLVNSPLRRAVEDLVDRTPVVHGFPGMMHDGILRDGRYYWTTVDGKIIIADAEKMAIAEQIDLQPLYEKDEPGWCRGLEVIGDLAFVGFTRFRKPSKMQFLKFAVRGRRILPSHILCYDMKTRRAVADWMFEREDAVVYGIYQYPHSV